MKVLRSTFPNQAWLLKGGAVFLSMGVLALSVHRQLSEVSSQLCALSFMLVGVFIFCA